uniref:Disease resistance R13L4/SHOC-2-like LRR domain-containing protein n=1 Tax=Arundo donax TaxID=35708 RepID=A0A0A8XS30_ARUDO
MEPSSDGKVRRLSACRKRDKHASNTKCPHLRTLIAVGPYTSTPDKLCWISSESIYLVVLELQDSSIDVVPTSVGNLFNLRYLGLRCTKVKSLPKSITKLLNLQTLDLKSTSIEKLPEGMRKLNRLRHLFADTFTEETVPESQFFKGVIGPKGLSCLEQLQTIETIEASTELGKQLEKMEELRSICIDNVKASHCKDLFTTLLRKQHLSSLLVSASDSKEKLCLEDNEMTSVELHKLVIRGCLAEGILCNFIFPDKKNKVKHLSLNSCQFEDDPLQLLAEHLPELTCLRFNNVKCKPDLVLAEGKFRFLKTLFLKGMISVQQLTIHDGAIPKVEAFYLDTIPNLKKVPDGFQSLRFLKKLWLLGVAPEFRTEWTAKGWHQKLCIVDIRVEE